jgi:8-amino-7-oxononanoate synthase
MLIVTLDIIASMNSEFDPGLENLRGKLLLRRINDRASAQGRLVTFGNRQYLNFSSNDYLALANHASLKASAIAALDKFGTGGGASRVLGGGCLLHGELENKLAALKGTGEALLFGSGYCANTGILPAISRAGDALFSDELNHASLIDGCRLSRAVTHVYRHGDPTHLEGLLRDAPARRKIVVTDTVFSMDGDIAPLRDIYGLCVRYGALLYIDDAHGTGVLGPDTPVPGTGALGHFDIKDDERIIQMGTCSKALGSHGAFVAGDSKTIQWIVNTARSLLFSTALPAHAVSATLKALEILSAPEGILMLKQLWSNQRRLLGDLKDLGLDTGGSETPIIPVLMDSVASALDLSEHLYTQGIYAPAIRPPTVKRPRIRFTVTAAHTGEDIERLTHTIRKRL